MKTIQDDNFTLVLERDYFEYKSEQDDLVERICERLRHEFIYCYRCGRRLLSPGEPDEEYVERAAFGPDPHCSKCPSKRGE